MSIVFANANILQAFDGTAIGSRVVRQDSFKEILREAVSKFDFDAQDTPGQGFVPLPASANYTVSAGVGKKRDDPSAYVLRSWRGSVDKFLKREHAAPVESLAVIVYTRAAYVCDPDVQADKDELYRINDLEATHIIVAVLASAGPRPPLSPGRLVSNLAGGNKDALAWDADTIREKAAQSSSYAGEWSVVAD